VNNEINNLQKQIKDQSDNISSLEAQIEALIESQANVKKVEYIADEFNEETNRGDLSISFSLKEISKNSRVTVIAKGKNNKDDIISVIAEGLGIYEAKLNLDINEEYSI